MFRKYELYRFSIENNCSISLNSNLTGDLSRLKIGECTVINGNANFRFKYGKIEIGQNCLIANNVSIICHSYIIKGMEYISPDKMYSKDVTIGDHVWVGGNVVILPGVKVGDNAIIGASSLVTKSVPSNEVWGGVPAKLLYKRNDDTS
jgi:maltose O-acetyltransferase